MVDRSIARKNRPSQQGFYAPFGLRGLFISVHPLISTMDKSSSPQQVFSSARVWTLGDTKQREVDANTKNGERQPSPIRFHTYLRRISTFLWHISSHSTFPQRVE